MTTVPESVLAYFQQPAVQTSVDLLLAGKQPKVPRNLQWSEVPSFYRACQAAQQVPAEFALFTEELWRAVWAEAPAPWKAKAPSDPARSDLVIGISTIWDEGCFSRRFEWNGYALELSIGLWRDTGLQLGLLLYDAKERVILESDALKGWSRAKGYDTFWTDDEIVALGASVPTEPFKPWTDQAWEAVAAGLARA